MDFRGWLLGLGLDLREVLGGLGVDVEKLEATVGLDVETMAAALTGLLLVLTAALLFRFALARRKSGPQPAPVGAPTEAGAPAAPVSRPSDADALYRGLTKTRTGLLARLDAILGRGGLDPSVVEELETALVSADIGIRTSSRLIAEVSDRLEPASRRDPEAVKSGLEQRIGASLGPKLAPWNLGTPPYVVLVIGVNGVGKTTTIGKIAARYVAEGKKVVLAAGDTFRAAAVEQLEVWGERAGAEVVKGEEGADPASVMFSAVERARAAGADLLLCDTAGRLQTKANLMQELARLQRVLGKALPGAPHEVLLVLDANTGQNGISQAKTFSEVVTVHSLALTKLDGTAKGGVVVAIADELGLPVRFVGVGEGADDLRDFDPQTFVRALFASATDHRGVAVDGPTASS